MSTSSCKDKGSFKEENVVSTIVDNEIAVENLTKFAKVKIIR